MQRRSLQETCKTKAKTLDRGERPFPWRRGCDVSQPLARLPAKQMASPVWGCFGHAWMDHFCFSCVAAINSENASGFLGAASVRPAALSAMSCGFDSDRKGSNEPSLESDSWRLNHARPPSLHLGVILWEDRYPLFRIIPWVPTTDIAPVRVKVAGRQGGCARHPKELASRKQSICCDIERP